MLTDLLLTSLLSGTDGPTDFSAGGLWGRGEEDLSSSVTSVVTTSTASTCWIGVSGSRKTLIQKKWVSCTAGHLYSMWIFFFFLDPNISFNDPWAVIAVNLL